ncbi:hypothetical protein [Priestia endophytica]|uniref:hypothetical protein n=1 Tax=Priestia endophytica TaxID=135735 RepID=UPI000F524B16|nr:hypothetical protein [Priestia endophytica]RPK13109.1 hypothetical protein FH5_03315 [Priestia endophytica]
MKMFFALLLMSSLSFSLAIVLDLFMNYSVARAIRNVFYGFHVMAALEFFLFSTSVSCYLYRQRSMATKKKQKKLRDSFILITNLALIL